MFAVSGSVIPEGLARLCAPLASFVQAGLKRIEHAAILLNYGNLISSTDF
jgi:hypothetical protein